MTKKAKSIRSVVCVIVSFLLSVLLFFTSVCLVFKLTALNGSFAVRVAEKTGYTQALHKELKEQFVSYGNAGNVDEVFFDDVFERIVTPALIQTDTEAVIHDFYNGETKSAVDTSDMEAKLSAALLEYAKEKGYTINDELRDSIGDMASQFGALYNSFVSLFSNSYFQTAGNMLNRYTPYVNYAIIGTAVLALVALFVLRMAYKRRKNVYRYYIYAFSGTTLMLLAGPAVALIMQIGNRINIGTASLYGLASGLINGVFTTFLIGAGIMAGIVALLIGLRTAFVKKNR